MARSASSVSDQRVMKMSTGSAGMGAVGRVERV